MASWIRNFFLDQKFQAIPKWLSPKIICASILALQIPYVAAVEKGETGELKINSEVFDIGLTFGFINIEDFPSEMVAGITANFRASEYFFLQYNYVQTNISKSSFENNPGFTILGLGDREFKHYDLLLGRNVFQGEFFTSNNKANLSTLYVLGGIGDTDFGGEKNFTLTLGAGYQLELLDQFILSFDYRSYIYKSSLIIPGEEDTSHNTQFSSSLRYLF